MITMIINTIYEDNDDDDVDDHDDDVCRRSLLR